MSQRYVIYIYSGLLKIHDDKHRQGAKLRRSSRSLYILQLKPTCSVCLLVHHDNSVWLWHEHYGHLHFDALYKLAREEIMCMVPQLDRVHQLRNNCFATKPKRMPSPTWEKGHAKGMLNLVHSDLCGIISPAAPDDKI
jgi:hypothetical protein